MEQLTLRETKSSISWYSRLWDYVVLTKPRVLSLLLLTTLVAMLLTVHETPPSPLLILWTLIGSYLAAGGASAFNCALDYDIDQKMGRTSKRPVPGGRISPRQAFWFGLVLCGLAFGVLVSQTTVLAGVLAMAGVVYYVFIYTHWLKRRTWWNVVIGGGAGALAPLVGWAAVTGSLPWQALFLSAVIFFWTPSHSWALALNKKAEYACACVPMLPVVMGERQTRLHIFFSAIMTALLTPLLALSLNLGAFYLVVVLVLNNIFLCFAWDVWNKRGTVWGFYFYSLLYLTLLFGSMVIDKMVWSGPGLGL